MKKSKVTFRKKKNRYRTSPDVKVAKKRKYFFHTAMVLGTFLAFLILSCICVFGYHYLITTPFLKIKGITIEGCQRLSPEEIKSLAAISPGENLLAVNLRKVREKIKQNPWVENVTINRGIPDQLFISIKEKDPLALAFLGRFFLVDKQGRIILPVKIKDFPGYPILTGLNKKKTLETGRIPHELTRQLREFSHAEVRNRDWFHLDDISEIHWSDDDGLVLFTVKIQPLYSEKAQPIFSSLRVARDNLVQPCWFTLKDSVKIELGKEDFQLKLVRLREILSVVSKRGLLNKIKGINLRNTKRIFVRGKFQESLIAS